MNNRVCLISPKGTKISGYRSEFLKSHVVPHNIYKPAIEYINGSYTWKLHGMTHNLNGFSIWSDKGTKIWAIENIVYTDYLTFLVAVDEYKKIELTLI